MPWLLSRNVVTASIRLFYIDGYLYIYVSSKWLYSMWCNCCPPTPMVVVIIATQYVQQTIFPGFIFLISKRTTSEGAFVALLIPIWRRLLTCSRTISISMKNWVSWNLYFFSWFTNNKINYEEVVFVLYLYVYIILWTFLSS